MNRYLYFKQVKIEDGKLQMIVSNDPIIQPVSAKDQYNFYSKIKLDENGKIIVKIKQ